jgi:hypothetical protein
MRCKLADEIVRLKAETQGGLINAGWRTRVQRTIVKRNAKLRCHIAI